MAKTHQTTTIYDTVDVPKSEYPKVSDALDEARQKINQAYNGKYAGRWKMSKAWADKNEYHVTFEVST